MSESGEVCPKSALFGSWEEYSSQRSAAHPLFCKDKHRGCISISILHPKLLNVSCAWWVFGVPTRPPGFKVTSGEKSSSLRTLRLTPVHQRPELLSQMVLFWPFTDTWKLMMVMMCDYWGGSHSTGLKLTHIQSENFTPFSTLLVQMPQNHITMVTFQHCWHLHQKPHEI